MAKTLSIRVPAGQDNPDSVDAIVVPPSLVRATLGTLAVAILSASIAKQAVVVDFDARKVYSRDAEGMTPLADLGALTGVTNVETVKQLTPGARSVMIDAEGVASDVTIVPAAGVLEDLLSTPEVISVSASQIVNAVEDNLLADVPTLFDATTHKGFLLIDQESGLTTLFKVANANVFAFRGELIAGETFDASAVYEQIPAEEESGAAIIPYEG